MINKRIWAFAFHLITWSIVLTIPFFFGPREKIGTESFPLSVLAVWGILAVFYFLNHYILIPAILLQKKFFLYLLLVLLFAATLFLIPEFSYRIYGDRTLPAPSEVSNIGRLCLVVSFLLILIISSSTAVIKELFATWTREQVAQVGRMEAELSSLRLQVNPHFLFNTLYNIYYLASNRPNKTQDAILKLSEMMRFLFSESQEKFIPLYEEIEFIQRYIELQRLRISEKTKIKFEIVGDYKRKRVAPMLLFPFVENAFKYGVSSHEEATIYVGLLVSEQMIRFNVANQKMKIAEEVKTNNFGLKNVIQRLNLVYPRLHKLNIFNENKDFSIDLKIFDNEEDCIYNFI